MSFDPLSLPNNNNNSTLSQLQMNNTQPNSLKRVSSPQFQYKYSKNKHLSQQIHKKKKNRNKQKYHKKKKLIKIKQNKALNKPPNRRKPKLKKTQLLTPLINQNDDIDYTYIKKHNEMNHKHKKIQVINNNNKPHYYFQTTKISNKNLNNYNYNSNANKSKLSLPPPTLPTIPNNKPIHKPNILWLASPQILKCSPSPMANTLLNQSPLMLNQIATNKGEVLMGFETKFQLSDGMISQASNCQLSVISDYKYEGVQNVNYNINNCLNTLKSINLYKNNYTSKEISINTLNEMELIIKQLKNKIINVNDNEHKYDNNICLSTDNDATDSSFLRSHISNINTTETDDEHENEDEEYDNDSNKSMILGVKFIENATADGDNDNVVYYD